MPTISTFLGILVKMNWKDTGKHNVPHIHVYYGEYEAVFTLDGEILAGEFPKRQAAYIKAWALLHDQELRDNWELAKNGEETFAIRGLQ